ncbi:hypothetical protein CDFC105_63986 [Clostridioides difficile]|nr:hypothetical protein CDFC105_63986 [Clostridioides difficile]
MCGVFFFLGTGDPPRSTHCISSAASDVYKRQGYLMFTLPVSTSSLILSKCITALIYAVPVSYTHLRAHETRHDLVCRLLLEKKKNHRHSPSHFV